MIFLFVILSVDDGTGVITCCQWRVVEDSGCGLTVPVLGQLVSVFGRVSEFREEKQIKVSAIRIPAMSVCVPACMLAFVRTYTCACVSSQEPHKCAYIHVCACEQSRATRVLYVFVVFLITQKLFRFIDCV